MSNTNYPALAGIFASLLQQLFSMVQLHPQFITNAKGEQQVVLSLKEYEEVMEALDELEDIHLYDAAKLEDEGERITLDEYRQKRKLD